MPPPPGSPPAHTPTHLAGTAAAQRQCRAFGSTAAAASLGRRQQRWRGCGRHGAAACCAAGQAAAAMCRGQARGCTCWGPAIGGWGERCPGRVPCLCLAAGPAKGAGTRRGIAGRRGPAAVAAAVGRPADARKADDQHFPWVAQLIYVRSIQGILGTRGLCDAAHRHLGIAAESTRGERMGWLACSRHRQLGDCVPVCRAVCRAAHPGAARLLAAPAACAIPVLPYMPCTHASGLLGSGWWPMWQKCTTPYLRTDHSAGRPTWGCLLGRRQLEGGPENAGLSAQLSSKHSARRRPSEGRCTAQPAHLPSTDLTSAGMRSSASPPIHSSDVGNSSIADGPRRSWARGAECWKRRSGAAAATAAAAAAAASEATGSACRLRPSNSHAY